MISTRQLYKGMLEAYDNEKDWLLPTKTTQIVVPFEMVEVLYKQDGERMRRELEEEVNPWGLDFGSYNSSDLDSDISDQIEEKFSFIFSDDWEDCE